MKRTAKRYFICLIFTFELALLVVLSEMIRLLLVNATNSYTILNVSWILLWLFGVIPLSLMGLWFVNAIGIEKLFLSVGLTEHSLEEKEKRPRKTEQEPPEETESEKLKREFQKRAA